MKHMNRAFVTILALVLVVAIAATTVFAAEYSRGKRFADADNNGICDNQATNCVNSNICVSKNENCGGKQENCNNTFVDADNNGVCDNKNEICINETLCENKNENCVNGNTNSNGNSNSGHHGSQGHQHRGGHHG